MEVRGWVLSALGRRKISYRLIKAVGDTELGRELVDELVENLVEGVIPPAFKETRVVFIPKPERGLTLMNFVGNLGKKVVADRI